MHNNYITMLYLSDSPVSQFSSFEEEAPQQIPQRRLKSAIFEDFSYPLIHPQNNSYHEDINIVNKMHRNQHKQNHSLESKQNRWKYQKYERNVNKTKKYSYQINPTLRDQTVILQLKIEGLSNQIFRLIQENNLLRQINNKVHEKLELKQKQYGALQHAKIVLQQQIRAYSQIENITKLQGQKNPKKNRIQSLISQLNSMKKSISALKEETKKYRVQNCSLELQKKELLEKNESMKRERSWQQGFINMFVEMCNKLCPEIEQSWVLKKKTQIGWKVVKNIVQRSITKGIKPPRIEKEKQKRRIKKQEEK